MRFDQQAKSALKTWFFLAILFFALDHFLRFPFDGFAWWGTGALFTWPLSQFLGLIKKPHWRRFFILAPVTFLFWLMHFGRGISHNPSELFLEVSFSILGGAIILGSGIAHTLIAKVILPPWIKRVYCSYACWYLLPFEIAGHFFPKRNLPGKNLRFVKYIVFALWLGAIIWLGTTPFRVKPMSLSSYHWTLIEEGAIVFLGVALTPLLGFRWFCRFACPFAVIMTPFSRFTILKVKVDQTKCTLCGECERVCPMAVPLTKYIKRGKDITDTECVLCENCVRECPTSALST